MLFYLMKGGNVSLKVFIFSFKVFWVYCVDMKFYKGLTSTIMMCFCTNVLWTKIVFKSWFSIRREIVRMWKPYKYFPLWIPTYFKVPLLNKLKTTVGIITCRGNVRVKGLYSYFVVNILISHGYKKALLTSRVSKGCTDKKE